MVKSFWGVVGVAGMLSVLTAQADYQSPFAITLDARVGDWTSDYASRTQAVVDHSTPHPAEWYTESTNYGAYPYGPLNPQLYSSATADQALVDALRTDRGSAVYNVAINSAPSDVDLVTWQRQRLLYVAKQLIGTHYQHLHLPTFNPASVTNGTFQWSPVSTNTVLQTSQDLINGQAGTAANPYASTYGSPQPGIDCTDFSAYIYNVALGIQMHSGTPSQIQFTSGSGPEVGNNPIATIVGADGNQITPNFIKAATYGTSAKNEAGSLDGVIAQLQPGDLLYMKAGGGISHVVVWLGAYGTNADGSPSTVPLIISSHDNTPAIFDTQAIDLTTGLPLDGLIEDHLPPPGVQILPFTSENWFYQSFSVAMQVVAVPEPSSFALMAVVIPLLSGLAWRARRARL
jgi:cell wall-associated NlpC family hydrolase